MTFLKFATRRFLYSYNWNPRFTNRMEMSTFQGVKDNFGGVVVRSSREPHERAAMETILKGIQRVVRVSLGFSSQFVQYLHKESLRTWTENGIRGVWFEVEPSSAEWIPVLIQVSSQFE